ncbi:PPOX class F420-dependent oxidoreductase [Streptomyces sp. NBC_01808]|uniref:PPOX class F420-dependent oxidoreductase n=1 Tax=Streptomyces sp. NBC_01808 TaxID=2975947 RepID=UPI002DD8A127|nr:PPOX class F420-dependent oxidoreductase [Streptomyces sp. NBC_01808]WSA38552.1 PPOX class F420-dependent oxidoreductase [Streptomyces sp. NBC_01808]
MSVALPANLKQVLDGQVFITVATVQPDGAPQASPVWVKRDGDDLLFSTTAERVKARNLNRDPRISVVVIDPAAPYNYAQVRGTASVSTEGARELIDELSVKYTGKDYDTFSGGHGGDGTRVVVRVTPETISGQGNLH